MKNTSNKGQKNVVKNTVDKKYVNDMFNFLKDVEIGRDTGLYFKPTTKVPSCLTTRLNCNVSENGKIYVNVPQKYDYLLDQIPSGKSMMYDGFLACLHTRALGKNISTSTTINAVMLSVFPWALPTVNKVTPVPVLYVGTMSLVFVDSENPERIFDYLKINLGIDLALSQNTTNGQWTGYDASTSRVVINMTNDIFNGTVEKNRFIATTNPDIDPSIWTVIPKTITSYYQTTFGIGLGIGQFNNHH
jgi:hypothetical protein